MYLKMLKIYTYLDVNDPNTFINVINPEELGIRYKGHRNLYIWSEMFNKMENEHLLAFLRNNEIQEVLLSPGREFNKEKVSDFVYKAYAQKIKVHLMIGENSLLSNDAAVVLKQRFELVKGLPLEGIHLDVEPQVLDDYKQNRQAYHDKLVSVLTDAKTLCIAENYKLSASVPLSFEISELSRIYELCDKVYLMAYEHPDLDYIKRKTADAISVSAEKSIIALSPSDFTDRLSMELFIEKMVQEMGVHQIAIHDLRRLIEIDNRSIQKVN